MIHVYLKFRVALPHSVPGNDIALKTLDHRPAMVNYFDHERQRFAIRISYFQKMSDVAMKQDYNLSVSNKIQYV